MDATPKLVPAKDLAARATRPYPNDSDDYRKARIALLEQEIELRRHITRVAAQRRTLPLGGKAKDYRFRDEQGKELGLADLFGRHETLVTYFWMYGPQRERPCPMCTSFLGALDVPSVDLTQRVAFAILGRSPVARQLAFARERGWRNLAFYETIGDDFARDDGSEWASLDVWVRKGTDVHHFWAAETTMEMADPGQDPHLAPEPVPIWTILDLTPGGRGTDWYPKLAYD